MVRDELQKLLDADPFVPFQLTLSSGQTYVIRYPALMSIGKDIAFVAHSKSELQSIIRLTQIASVDTME